MVSRLTTMPKTDIPLTFNNTALSTISPNFYIGGLSGQPSNFEHRPRPKQCYNCQELADGIAHRCEKLPVCGRCAKKKKRSPSWHMHRNDLKCVSCGGPKVEPKESFRRNCWKLYPTRHKLNRSELCSYMCGVVKRTHGSLVTVWQYSDFHSVLYT